MDCNKEEAARAKDIALKKMQNRDFIGARKIALKAQQLFPDLENLSHILTVCEVHSSAAIKVNGETNWYGILQVESTSNDLSIKKQYRKLALLLNPDKNQYAGAEEAFKLVCEAHLTLSDRGKRAVYDMKQKGSIQTALPRQPSHQFKKTSYDQNNFTKVNFNSLSQQKPPASHASQTFWTMCSTCNMRFQYFRNILNRTFRCQNCLNSFFAYDINSEVVPPNVNPGNPCNNVGVSKQHVPGHHSTNATVGALPRESMSGRRGLNSYQRGGPTAAKVDVKDARYRYNCPTDREQKAVTVPTSNVNHKRGRKSVANSNESEDGDIEDSTTKESAPDKSTAPASKPRRSTRLKQKVAYNDDGSEDDHNDFANRPDKKLRGESSSNVNGDENELPSDHVNRVEARVNRTGLCSENCKQEKYPTDGPKGSEQLKDEKMATVPENDVNSISNGAPVECTFSYPDSEFFDFEESRSANRFAVGHIWAVYDNVDGMPRFYAWIKKVYGPDFKLHLTWLERSRGTSAENAWLDKELPVSCGNFSHGYSMHTDDQLMFSHVVSWEMGRMKNSYDIYPRKGEVWALFKDWSIEWSSNTDINKVYQYELVEVISDFAVGTGVSVVSLVKIEGFVSLFMRVKEKGAAIVIPVSEMLRFSHNVPAYRLSGTEREGIPKGSLELDPASLPSDFQGAFPTISLDNKTTRVEKYDEYSHSCSKNTMTKEDSDKIEQKENKNQKDNGSEDDHNDFANCPDKKLRGESSSNVNGDENELPSDHVNRVEARVNRTGLCSENCKQEKYPTDGPKGSEQLKDEKMATVPENDVNSISNGAPVECTFSYPDSEFFDFEESRSANRFAVGHIWAVYDNVDGMPRFYAWIKKVYGPDFKLHLTWLERSRGTSAENAWLDKELPVSCGNFSHGYSMHTDDQLMFSHVVSREMGRMKNSYDIYPRKGEVWALFKDWSIEWSSNTDINKVYQYELVEVISDFAVGTGVSVVSLVKIEGFVSLFMRVKEKGAAIVIPVSEMLRFSHNVPAYRLSGTEREGIPKGSLELDPASLPSDFQGAFPTISLDNKTTRVEKYDEYSHSCSKNTMTKEDSDKIEQKENKNQKDNGSEDDHNDFANRPDKKLRGESSSNVNGDENELPSDHVNRVEARVNRTGLCSENCKQEKYPTDGPKGSEQLKDEKMATVPENDVNSISNGAPVECTFSYPDSEFFDFEESRSANRFAVGHIWAVYDNVDGMPRFYAWIKKVYGPDFKLHLTWLERSRGTSAENAWLDKELPVSCGNFSHGYSMHTDDQLMFSHVVSWEMGRMKNSYDIYPRKGEVWALFKDWSIEWSSNTDINKVYQYELVEVISDFAVGTGVSVVSLVKIEGFVSLFMRVKEKGAAIVIPVSEMLRFSHNVPAYRLSGTEREGIPKGSLELDPASLPSDFQGAFPTISLDNKTTRVEKYDEYSHSCSKNTMTKEDSDKIEQKENKNQKDNGSEDDHNDFANCPDKKLRGESSSNVNGDENELPSDHVNRVEARVNRTGLCSENCKQEKYPTDGPKGSEQLKDEKMATVPENDVNSISNGAPVECTFSYPDSEFFDFEESRSANRFAVGHIWAVYDNVDGMPRFYAWIKKVYGPDFKLHLTWLERSRGTSAENAWLDKELPVSCGNFSHGYSMHTDDQLMFSHVVSREMGRMKNSYDIYPRKGEVWALFKDWSIEWSSNTDINKVYQYELVEVISDFAVGTGVSVVSLVKIEGFVSLFMRVKEKGAAIVIPVSEMLRFSHNVPAYRLSGTEREGIPKGSLELDPASLPSDFQGAFPTISLDNKTTRVEKYDEYSHSCSKNTMTKEDSDKIEQKENKNQKDNGSEDDHNDFANRPDKKLRGESSSNVNGDENELPSDHVNRVEARVNRTGLCSENCKQEKYPTDGPKGSEQLKDEKMATVPENDVNSISNGAPVECTFSYPDSEFFDFEESRSANRFAVGHIWAVYDNVDGMPRFYAWIKKVYGPDFKLHLTWLERSRGTSAENAWLDKELPVSCGNFSHGYSMHTDDQLMFSHVVSREMGRMKNSYDIYPRKGEVWALFKDWSIEWSSNTDINKVYQYELVEVISDFAVGTGVSVVSLVKIEGFVSLFMRVKEKGAAIVIPVSEMLRFSHNVPAYRLSGTEREGIPKGSLELDPASLPSDFHGAFPTISLDNKTTRVEKLDEYSHSCSKNTMTKEDSDKIEQKENKNQKDNAGVVDLDHENPEDDNGFDYPNLEFNDFNQRRGIGKFQCGQIWALYCDIDEYPKYYARVTKVEPVDIRIHILWLEACPMREEEERWVEEKIPLSCGTFEISGEKETFESTECFSHLVNAIENRKRKKILILPGVGEIWAMYKNWKVGWNRSDLKDCQYDVARVVGVTVSGSGVQVVLLTKLPGYTAVFKPESSDVIEIPFCECIVFSHQIPAIRLTTENGGKLRGYWELDTASIPRPLLSMETSKRRKCLGNKTTRVEKLDECSRSCSKNSMTKEDSDKIEQKENKNQKDNAGGVDLDHENPEDDNGFDYPKPEFNDFNQRRGIGKFQCGQIWALYCDIDEYPKYYARVTKVEPVDIQIHILWLEACPMREEEERWVDEKIPLSCGTFEINGEKEMFESTECFSHLVNAIENHQRKKVLILPGVGEIWAMYKNWKVGWNHSDLKDCQYDVVRVVGVTVSGSGVQVVPLTKLPGYTAVFKPESSDVIEVPFCECIVFSHQIPAIRLTTENGGKLRGYWELDTASIPRPLLSMETSKRRKCLGNKTTQVEKLDECSRSCSKNTMTKEDSGKIERKENKNQKDNAGVVDLDHENPEDDNGFDYPNPEFNDFNQRRGIGKFQCGQIWALYCDIDEYPKYYARVTKVEPVDIRIHILWLEACPMREEEERWVEEKIPLSCGTFEISGEKETFESTECFSHLVNAIENRKRKKILILPGVGEIWAMYKNWKVGWNRSDLKDCQYDVVRVVGFTFSGTGVQVVLLTKLPGYTAVFKPESSDVIEIPFCECIMFSHQIPAIRLTTENGGKLRGYWELDTVSIPRPLLSMDTSKSRK